MKRILSIVLLGMLLLGVVPIVSAHNSVEVSTVAEGLADAKHAKNEFGEEYQSLLAYDNKHEDFFRKEGKKAKRCIGSESRQCEKYIESLNKKLPRQLKSTANGYSEEYMDVALAAEDLVSYDERAQFMADNFAVMSDRYGLYGEKVEDVENVRLASKIGEKISKDGEVVMDSVVVEKKFSSRVILAQDLDKLQRILGRFIGEKEEEEEIASDIINDYDDFVEHRVDAEELYVDGRELYTDGVTMVANGDREDGLVVIARANNMFEDANMHALISKSFLEKTLKAIKQDFF